MGNGFLVVLGAYAVDTDKPKEADEQAIFDRMIERAKAYGLEAQVTELYDYYRSHGDSVGEAAWCALYEWDLCTGQLNTMR